MQRSVQPPAFVTSMLVEPKMQRCQHVFLRAQTRTRCDAARASAAFATKCRALRRPFLDGGSAPAHAILDEK